jgi:hypothetical protein
MILVWFMKKQISFAFSNRLDEGKLVSFCDALASRLDLTAKSETLLQEEELLTEASLVEAVQ